jgi:hypothetical protein
MYLVIVYKLVLNITVLSIWRCQVPQNKNFFKLWNLAKAKGNFRIGLKWFSFHRCKDFVSVRIPIIIHLDPVHHDHFHVSNSGESCFMFVGWPKYLSCQVTLSMIAHNLTIIKHNPPRFVISIEATIRNIILSSLLH